MDVSKFLKSDYTNEAIWYRFSSEIEVQIKKPTRGEVSEMTRKCSSTRMGTVIVNKQAFERLFYTSVVISWKGLKDSKGNDIPVTHDNVMSLMLHWNAFAEFVDSKVEIPDIGQEESAQEESAQKNLFSG